MPSPSPRGVPVVTEHHGRGRIEELKRHRVLHQPAVHQFHARHRARLEAAGITAAGVVLCVHRTGAAPEEMTLEAQGHGELVRRQIGDLEAYHVVSAETELM